MKPSWFCPRHGRVSEPDAVELPGLRCLCVQPEFWLLVHEAEQAGQAVDHFDVHSDNPTAMDAFNELLDKQQAAAEALIEYVNRMTTERAST